MKLINWFIFTSFFALSISAQVGVSPISDEIQLSTSTKSLRVHTGIFPANRQVDTNWNKESKKIKLQPLAEIAAIQGVKFNFQSNIGVGIEAYSGTKGHHKISYTAGITTGNSQFGLPENSWKSLSTKAIRWSSDLRWRSSYTLNRYLYLAIGIDQQFFGEGYRSLIQSDQVAPAPFAMARVNFKRLEYGLIYQGLHENQITSRLWKFNAIHYLSFNITKKWNAMLIESVTMQSKDSTFKRGFDLEYLNPIVFFRPQEYSLGSSDNVLIAAQTSYKLKGHTVYGQFTLDDFSLVELRARSKWWATKYAVQLGSKGPLTNAMNYRLELNVIRPYTYSHLSNGLNNAHSGLPLAHPLGANLAEFIAQVHWKKAKNNWKFTVQYYLQGLDFDADTSWGGDVYKSYNTRPKNKEHGNVLYKDYGNTIGQGLTQRYLVLIAEWNRQIKETWMNVFAQPQLMISYGEMKSRIQPMILVGCRSTLFQRRKLF